MDIKNILNDAERRPPRARPNPEQALVHSHPPSASSPRPPSPPYRPRPLPPHPSQPHHPPQQIVYTGPVYQLSPALPVRHVANSYEYRYTPYPYEEPQNVEYLYQEYAEVPRQTSQLCQIRYERSQPDPYQHMRPHAPRDSYMHQRYMPDDRDHRPRDEMIHPRRMHHGEAYQYRAPIHPPDLSRMDVTESDGPNLHMRRPSPPPYRPSSPNYASTYRMPYPPYKRMRDNRRQCIDFAYACRQQYRANSYKGERDYATSMDSSEAAENLRYTVVKSEHRREVATHRDDQTATDEDDLPLVRGFRSVKQESDAVSLARPRKKRRDRPKKSEIDTRDIVPLRKESPDLDLAGTRRQLSAQTRIDPPAHSTAAAYQWYPSEDEVVPPRKRATSTHLGKARKKRRLLPCNRRTATGGALRRSDMLHMDQDRKQNRSPVNHVPRRKERPRCPIVLEPESHEDQVLDGGDKYGQPIAAAASTSSFESGMRQRPEESRESSVQGGMRPCQNGIHAKIKSEPFVSQPKMRPNGKRLAPAVDPKEPYPDVKSEFGGIPPNAVGDLLQVWEFITAFSKTLRLSPFKLFHLQQAIMYPERCHLLDSILLRLVQAIVSDEGLVFELSIPDSVVKGLRGKNTKNDVNIVLQELPNILSFESDEVDDHFLQLTVEKLRQASRKLAFYKTIGPDGKLRILRELIDYATMTDSLRACVTDSMDHAEVEKKKAREENAAKRKKLDQQLRDLRTELLEYKLKNGLIDNTPPGETEKSAGGESKENGVKSESASINTDREEVLSRKEKMAALKKEKLEMEERREKERGAEAIAARMDKVRVNLKSLKNVRLRNRHKDDDGADASGNALTTTLADQYQDPVRTFPLGTDREERCYWFFQGSGRIWIENTKTGEWCTLNSVDGVNNLLKWLSPFRKQERMLKKKIRQRLGEVELEITQELKSMEQAEIEAREAADALPEFEPRTTRAGKRRASLEAKQRKKSKTVTTFLDYRNAGR